LVLWLLFGPTSVSNTELGLRYAQTNVFSDVALLTHINNHDAIRNFFAAFSVQLSGRS
jgi:hypothetical protein